MQVTRQKLLGVATPSIIIAILAFYFFYNPDPLARFEQECSSSTKIVEEKAEDGSIRYRKLLNSVEEIYVVSGDGKLQRLCAQVDSGAGGFTIDSRVADALGLRERGKVIPVRSANGRVKRKSIDVPVVFAGTAYPDAVGTKTDRTGLTYAANIGRDFMPEGATIDPSRRNPDKEEMEAEEKEEN